MLQFFITLEIAAILAIFLFMVISLVTDAHKYLKAKLQTRRDRLTVKKLNTLFVPYTVK